MSSASPRHFLSASLVLATLWWFMTGGRMDAWVVGVPAVLAASWFWQRARAGDPFALSPVGLLKLMPYFVLESLRGGTDVAIRTLRPSLPVKPGFIDFPLSLESQDARVAFALCINLLPGTVSARLGDGHLVIHLLNRDNDAEPELRRLETLIGQVFPERPGQVRGGDHARI